MLVNRMEFTVKHARAMEAVELIKAGTDYGLPRPPHGMRIYSPHIGAYDVVVLEVEFESLAELAAYFEEWWASPRVGEWVEKFRELREPGGSEAVWNLETVQ